jgi:flagellar motor switch protein FliN/FliY
MPDDAKTKPADPTPGRGLSGPEAAVRAAEDALKAGAAAAESSAAALSAVESALRDKAGASGDGPAPFEPPPFEKAPKAEAPKGIDLLSDVNLNVKIELGRTRMVVEDVLKLSEGAVIELDKLAGDPVDVYVNDRPVARGEVLVLNDNFCVRISEIIAGAIDAPDVQTAKAKAG